MLIAAQSIVNEVVCENSAAPEQTSQEYSIILQDRMKEWGKRYLEPFGSAIGIRFPDRIRKLHDYTGKVCIDCASPN
jgi:hypothetical protein